MNIQPLGNRVSVYFTKYSPIELKIDGRTYLIIKEEDILAICE